MPIYDLGYQRWEGELRKHPIRWWPILRYGFLAPLKTRRYLTLLFLAWTPALVEGVKLFLASRATRLGEVGVALSSFLGSGEADFFFGFLSRQMVLVLLFVVLVGTNLIARDRQFNALQIYFSKPLTQNDYLLGKLGIVAGYLMLVTWLPCMLLWIFALMVGSRAGYFTQVWTVPISATAFCLLWVVVAGGMILALSASGRRGVYIAGAWVILYGPFPLSEISASIQNISGNEYWGLLNVASNVKHVGAWWFGVEGVHAYHPLLSLVVLVAVVGICYGVLLRKIRPVEVVL